MLRVETRTTIGYVVLTLLAVAAFIVVLRPHQIRDARRVTQSGIAEIDFCRDVLTDLLHGDSSVVPRIDWEHFDALGVNVGRNYARLPDDQERAKYQKAFLSATALGFQVSRLTADAFINWRVHDRREGAVTVAADFPYRQRTLLFVLSATGQRRLEAMRWRDANGSG